MAEIRSQPSSVRLPLRRSKRNQEKNTVKESESLINRRDDEKKTRAQASGTEVAGRLIDADLRRWL